MNYEQFLEQMKEDLQARFAKDLPPELADVRIGIRDVEKLQGESYRGISFKIGDSPVEGKPFPQEAELREKSARLAELDAALNMDEPDVPVAASVDEGDISDVAEVAETKTGYGTKEKPSVLAQLKEKAAELSGQPHQSRPREAAVL